MPGLFKKNRWRLFRKATAIFVRIVTIPPVQLSATINKKKIRYDINKIYKKDPDELIQFSKNKFFNRKVLVCYQQIDNKNIQSPHVKKLINYIRDELLNYGFRIFLQSELSRIKKRIIEKTIDKETAIDYGRQEMTDAVIVVDFTIDEEKNTDGYLHIYGTANLSCFDVTTAELFANVEANESSVSRTQKFYRERATKGVTEKIAKKIVKDFVTKIVDRFSKTRQNSTTLIIKELPEQSHNQIVDIFDKFGWDYKIKSYIRSIIELEIFSELSATNIQKEFYKKCKERNILLYHLESKGSRILFSGKIRN